MRHVGGLLRRIPVRPKPRVQYRAGPFVGMRDSLDPTSADPVKAYLLQNVYPSDPARRSAVVGRPGFQQFATQLGSSGARRGQRAVQFTKQNGTEYSVVFVGGEVWTLDWAARTVTKVLTTAQLGAAGVTMSATAKVYATAFNDQLVVTDGVNTPWMWDGTTGAGVTELTNAPVIYGPFAVYYAKLFGIKAAERSTIVWSEENQANTGYEAGGYNNAWALTTTDTDPLTAVVGANEALYVFRARSTTVISGPVTPEFQTTGTREAISETVGTTSPDSIEYYERRVFFVDADFRPHEVTLGSEPTPIWEDVAETISGLDRTYIGDVVGVYDPATRQMLFAVTEIGQTLPSAQLAYNPRALPAQPTAVWRGYTLTSIDLLKNASGQPVLVHLSDDGYAYDHGQPNGSLWDDALNAGTRPIQHVVETAPAGYSEDITQTFLRADIGFRVSSLLTDLRASYTTPTAEGDVQQTTLTGALSLWDVAVWDTSKWSQSVEQHKAIGLNGYGRWIRFRLQHAALGEQFGLVGIKLSAAPDANDPAVL